MKKLSNLFGVLIVLTACLTQACQKSKEVTSMGAQPAVTAPGAATGGDATGETAGLAIATINGEKITDEEVRKKVGVKFAQAEMELYDLRKDAADQIIADKLLETEAKKQNTNKDALLKTEVFDKIKIMDSDIKKFYEEKKDRFSGKKLEDVQGNIRGFLFSEQHRKLYDGYIAKLKKGSEVAYLIKAPKIEVPEGDAPGIGPKDAKVRIVEFSDYQCPFCGRARPTINKINEEYKGKVRYVFRDFPLSFHKDAPKAHEASHCAGDQNKYWEMNKKLFSSQQALKIDDLKKYAQELKLNSKKFDECLDSGKHADKVKKETEEGSSLGVSGTPAYFINGRMISGARPFEDFQEVIEDELRKDS